MQDFNYLTLITVDDEEYQLRRGDVEGLDITNLKRNISYMTWSKGHEKYTCDSLKMLLATDATDEIDTRTLASNGRHNNLTERLIKLHDIKAIKLLLEDDSTLLLEVPWDFKDQDKNMDMYAFTEFYDEDVCVMFGTRKEDFFNIPWRCQFKRY